MLGLVIFSFVAAIAPPYLYTKLTTELNGQLYKMLNAHQIKQYAGTLYVVSVAAIFITGWMFFGGVLSGEVSLLMLFVIFLASPAVMAFVNFLFRGHNN